MAAEGEELRRLLTKLGAYIDDVAAKVHDLAGEVVAQVPDGVHPNVGVTVVQMDVIVEQLQKLSVHIREAAEHVGENREADGASQEEAMSKGSNVSVNDKLPMDWDSDEEPWKRRRNSDSSDSSRCSDTPDPYYELDGNNDSRLARKAAYFTWKREEMEEARRRELEEKEEARRRSDMLFELEKEKFELEQEKVAIQKELYQAEQKKIELMYTQEEERILGMDLSKLQAPLREYYEAKQQEILARIKRMSSKTLH